MDIGTVRAVLALRNDLSPELKSVRQDFQQVGASAKTAAADATKGLAPIAPSIGTVVGALQTMATAVGIAFSVQAIVGFGREILSFASHIEDVSLKIGITTEEAQALNYALSGSGVTIDQAADAVTQLARRLIGGDDGAVEALRSLHLQMSKVLEQNPAEAFLDIAEKVGQIEDPMKRIQVATELFGRSGANLIPAMRDNLRQLMQQAHDTHSVMSGELTASAGAFDDAIGHGVITLKAWTAQLISTTVSVLSAVTAWEAWKDTFTDVGALFGATGNMDATVAALDRAKVGAQAFVREGLDPAKFSAAEVKSAERELDEQLAKTTQTRKDNTQAIKEAQQAANDWARLVYDTEIEAILAADKALEDNKKAWEEGMKAANDQLAANEEALRAWGEAYAQEMLEAAQASERWERAVHDDMARNEHDMIAHKTTLMEAWRELGADMAERTRTLMGEIGDALGPKFGKIVGGMTGAWKDGQTLMKGIGKIMSGDFSGLIETMMAGIQLVKKAWQALKGLFSDEVEHANDTRDQFINAHWGSGEALAARLTELGAGEGGGSLYKDLIGASDVAGVNTAKAAIEQFLHGKGEPGFITGTSGLRDFGPEAHVKVHGKEEIRTEAQVRADTRMLDELRGLRADIRDLPIQMRDQLAFAMATR